MAKRAAIIELMLKDRNSDVVVDNLRKEFTKLNESAEGVGLSLDQGLKKVNAQTLRRVDQFSKSFNRGTKNIGNTGAAVTNLSRIIQDAPFGTIGVANNIEPFITSFQRMGDASTTTGQKIKMLITSAFTGPGALITIVSVATAALTAISMGFIDLGDDAEDTEEALLGVLDVVNKIIELQDQFGAFEDDPFNIAKLNAEMREVSERIQMQRADLAEINELQDRRRVIAQDVTKAEEGEFQAIDARLGQLGDEEDIKERINELETRRLEISNELVAISTGLADENTKDARAAQQRAEAKERELKAEKALQEARRGIGITTPEDRILGDGLPDIEGTEGAPASGSIEAQKQKLKSLQEAFEATPFAEGRNMIAEKIREAREELENMTGALEEGTEQQKSYGEEAARSFGQAAAGAIMYADTFEEAAANILGAIINQIVAKAILAAFQPPTPASLALAPIFAAAAQRLVSSFIGGFRSGVDDFQGGLARVHKDEMLVGLPQGANVITNQNVERLARMQRDASEGANALSGASSATIASAIKEGVKEGIMESDIRADVDIDTIDHELRRLRKYKERIGN